MAGYVSRRWDGRPTAATRAERQGGRYRAYVPDPLAERVVLLPSPLSRKVAEVERQVRALRRTPGSGALERFSRFLLRGEALASSRIEGLQVSPQQLALVELEETTGAAGRPRPAQLVHANLVVLRRAVDVLADAGSVTSSGVVELHDALLDDGYPGLREQQNWIGGVTPADADFVPPPPEEVPRLVDELADHCSGGTHSALVQAALAHAQFETVHPFADGNGRVGRALIHTVLRRRGLVAASVLPVSLVLQTRLDDYNGGLTAFRHEGPPDGPAARDGLVEWVDVFVEAAALAVDRALELAAAVDAIQQDWTRRLEQVRSDEGLRATPRADSAAGRLVALLPETPVVTVRTAAAALGTSENAARKALETLLAAGVVRTKRVGRATAYLADDVLALLALEDPSCTLRP